MESTRETTIKNDHPAKFRVFLRDPSLLPSTQSCDVPGNPLVNLVFLYSKTKTFVGTDLVVFFQFDMVRFTKPGCLMPFNGVEKIVGRTDPC